MSLGENIRRERLALGMTQEQLGQLLGMAPQTVSKWEREESMPDAALLPPLADALRCSLDRLFDRRQPEYRDAALMAADWLRSQPAGERWQAALRLARVLQSVLAGLWELPIPDVPSYLEEAGQLFGMVSSEDGISLSSRSPELPFFTLLPEPAEGWGPVLERDHAALWEALAHAEVRRVLPGLLRGELPRLVARDRFLEHFAPEEPEETLRALETLQVLHRNRVRIDGEETELCSIHPRPQLLQLLLLGAAQREGSGFAAYPRTSPFLRTGDGGGSRLPPAPQP